MFQLDLPIVTFAAAWKPQICYSNHTVSSSLSSFLYVLNIDYGFLLAETTTWLFYCIPTYFHFAFSRSTYVKA